MAKKSTSLPIAEGPTCSPKQTKEMIEREKKWRAEDALRVCQQYEENIKDKDLMKSVKQLAKQKVKEFKKVAGE